MRGLFVLCPHLFRLKPDAMIRLRAAGHNHANLAGFTAFAARDFESPAALPAEPALWGGDEQMQGELLLVRENRVVEAVVVDIHKAQAVVASSLIDDRHAAGQREGKFLPRLLGLRPREDAVLLF